jgi:cation diffusion facilitator CzcD-associated flavoprotein CzcO
LAFLWNFFARKFILLIMDNNKTETIIGAGPAGLTAAYELLVRTKIKPVIFEISSDIRGISKTVNYKCNRMDIGDPRFFSKSDRVMLIWSRLSRIYYLRKFLIIL